MAKHGKKYSAVKKQVSVEKLYGVEEAIRFLQNNPTADFDETLEIALRMGVDPTKSDQAIRSTVALPHGTGKDVRVIVFATGEAAEAARAAGALEAGYEDLMEKVTGDA
jgi:large subunit ribosomal protein L1